MTSQIFNQDDFLTLEDNSSNLDLLINPNNIELAKDPGNLVQNFQLQLIESITQNSFVNSWYLQDQQSTYDKTQTIDNGLCSLFFVTLGDVKYQNIFNNYKQLLPNTFMSGNDGQVPDWYNLTNFSNTGNTEARSCSYLLYSLTFHQYLNNFTLNRNLALLIAEQLIDLKESNSFLIRDNYNTTRCSLETNVIAYFALKLLIPYTDNTDIPDYVDGLRQNIKNLLGIKDNTADFNLITPKSCIFSGLFALSIGDLEYLDQSLSALKDFYIYDDLRLVGIGINNFDFIYTSLASILYYKANKKSYTYSFLSPLIEHYLSTQSFETINDSQKSPLENILWFLILNLIISNNFNADQLFR